MTETATDSAARDPEKVAVVDGTDDPRPLCATDPGNPACTRQMIPVDKLTAHPGNVRDDLDLTDEFCASVAASGVRVPLLITTDADGNYRVIEGHRRLAAAVKAGLEEVPFDLDSERAADEAGQFLDMVTANSAAYRKNFTALEEATALFAAHEAGATRTRIRKATGRKADQIKAALAAGGISSGTREQVANLDRQLALDDLALLAEFEADPQAMEELLRAILYRYPLEHAAERVRLERAEAAEHQRIRAELEAAGCQVTDEIVPGSMLLTGLAHDGEDLTEENHRDCPGHAAFFRSHDLRTPVFYCADPDANGHVSRWATAPAPAAATGAAGADEPSAAPDSGIADAHRAADPVPVPVPVPAPDPAAEEARRLIAQGDKAWAAAWEVRKRWVQQLLWRRTAPKEVIRFVARQLFSMPDALRRGLPAAAGRMVFIELTGKPLEAMLRDCGTYALARMPLLALAPIAIAYESEMAGEGERRNTWRTDAWAPCSRKDAAEWLKFLAGLGYELSAIEHAVVDGVPYTGDDTPDEPDTDDLASGDDDSAGSERTGGQAPAVGTAASDAEQTADDIGVTQADDADDHPAEAAA